MSIDSFLVVHEPSEDGAPGVSEDSATEDNEYSATVLKTMKIYCSYCIFFHTPLPGQKNKLKMLSLAR